MRALIFTYILSSSFLITASAQDLTTKLGLSLIPELSKPFIQKNSAPHTFDARLSYTGKFGLHFQQSITQNFKLRSGLLYALERYNVDVYNIYLEGNNFAEETEIKEEIQLGSMLLPLQLLYQINSQWSVFTGVGLQLPFYDQRYRYIINGGEEEDLLLEKDIAIQRSWVAFSFGLSRTIQKKFLDVEISPQLWLHTHQMQIPLQASTQFQITAGLELTAWLF